MAEAAPAGLLSSYEAERLVESLSPLSVSEIGSQRWMDQHLAVMQLSTQAHHNAVMSRDEFVVEALVTFQKIPVVVHQLIALDVWKEHVLPFLAPRMADLFLKSYKPYSMIFSECQLVNFLEVVLFHRIACESALESLLELVDYCQKKITGLNIRQVTMVRKDKQKEKEEWLTQQEDVEFAASITTLSLVRSMIDHAGSVAPSVLTRILESHDLPLQLVWLLQKRPWVRRTEDGVERFVESKWVPVKGDDMMKVTKCEAQCWLALIQVVLGVECRRKYSFTNYRVENFVKLIPLLHEVLLDQIPALSDLKQVLTQISVSGAPPAPSSPFLIQQLPELRAFLERGQNWRQIADELAERLASEPPEQKMNDVLKMNAVFGSGVLDDIIEPPMCAHCGNLATQRCSRCKTEWYCGRQCQIAAWAKHKELCNTISAASQKA